MGPEVAAHPATRRHPAGSGGVPGVVSMPTDPAGRRWPRPIRCCGGGIRPPPSSSTLDRSAGRAGRWRIDHPPGAGRQAHAAARPPGGWAETPIATNAVDHRPVHRARQRPVKGRDELQGVALVLGRAGDAFGEGPEERVREDQGQRLRREQPDRPRRALGEHPGDRVRPVAERLRDRADPDGRLWREATGPVERERHGRFRDAGLARDVGDARTAPGPLLHGYLGCGDGRSQARGGWSKSFLDQPVAATRRRLVACVKPV